MEQISEDQSEIPLKFWVKCVSPTCGGYCWQTRTKLQYISCPNCRHTNKVAEARKKYSDERCSDASESH